MGIIALREQGDFRGTRRGARRRRKAGGMPYSMALMKSSSRRCLRVSRVAHRLLFFEPRASLVDRLIREALAHFRARREDLEPFYVSGFPGVRFASGSKYTGTPTRNAGPAMPLRIIFHKGVDRARALLSPSAARTRAPRAASSASASVQVIAFTPNSFSIASTKFISGHSA